MTPEKTNIPTVQDLVTTGERNIRTPDLETLKSMATADLTALKLSLSGAIDNMRYQIAEVDPETKSPGWRRRVDLAIDHRRHEIIRIDTALSAQREARRKAASDVEPHLAFSARFVSIARKKLPRDLYLEIAAEAGALARAQEESGSET